jgi:hypothetical protein
MDYKSKYDTEFSQEFGFENQIEEAAAYSADTCCKTFKPKFS